MSNKKTILIVDDIEINREILAEIFKEDYEIIKACNGVQAVEILDSHSDISAVLLDLIMPELDGLGVLRELNKNGKIDRIPVFLITAENSRDMLLEGYHLGAVDVITKPFIAHFLVCRVNNVVELYEHRNELERKVAEQVERLNRFNQSMIETLATLIEFRDCESGEHVRRICGLTGIIMTEVSNTYPEYYLPKAEIDKIVSASILHDVGKISTPDGILNKPGRLTNEEFEIMKQHTVQGCEILKSVYDIVDEETYNYSYDICRHHHERWDGRGYPDHLAGDEIPISAQVVAITDVYDALISPRVYKSSFTADEAYNMIVNGECGQFPPDILECFKFAKEKFSNIVELNEMYDFS